MQHFMASGGTARITRARSRTTHTLHQAVSEGSLDRARCIVKGDPCAALQKDRGGNTPLHRAAETESPLALQVLLLLLSSAPAAAREVNHDGMLPLHLAARGGCLESLSALMMCTPNPNLLFTLMHLAASSPRHSGAKVQRLLPKLRGSLWKVDGEGNTPLHLAAAAGNVEAARLLLEASGDCANVLNHRGETPAHLAAQRYFETHTDHSRACLCLLIGATAHEHLRHLARYSADDPPSLMHCAVVEGHEDLVLALLTADPAFARSRDAQGLTALHTAAQHGDPGIISVLVQAGGCSLALFVDAGGRTPLHYAAMADSWQGVEYLLAVAPQAATTLSNQLHAPLILALHEGHPRSARLLLEAAPEMALDGNGNGDGDTALAKALICKCQDLAVRMVELNPETAADEWNADLARNSLHVAADLGLVRVVEAILQHSQHCAPGIASSVSQLGFTPLHFAVKDIQPVDNVLWRPRKTDSEACQIVRMLLRAAPATASEADEEGCLPLHLAARQQLVAAARELVLAAPDSIFARACQLTPFETSLFYFRPDVDGDYNLMADMLLRAPGQDPKTLLEALAVRDEVSWRGIELVMSW